MSRTSKEQKLINQIAWILNYQPNIHEQHIHIDRGQNEPPCGQAQAESGEGTAEPVVPEEAQQEGRKEVALPVRIRRAIEVMQQEEVLRYKYDYAWLKVIMDSTEGLPSFRSAQSFVDYLRGLGVADVPSESSISRYMDLPRGRHPQWTFADTSDGRECQRRNLVASRFLSLVRKGG